MSEDIFLIEEAEGVRDLCARAARTDAIAVDVEANGLFAYRPRLCTVQIGLREGDLMRVGIVDALRAPIAPLAAVLGPAGPIKVLHDLTFDARLLAEAGAPLGNVRDTSVAARLLERAATGLAALLASELGISVAKGLQQHDWARRPLTRAELRYLAEDVLHLLALDARLSARAAELEIEGEIADECAYKLQAALWPPRDGRPAYARIHGAAALDRAGRAVLRRLAMARDAAAREDDVPPFKIAGNDVLLELARRRPATLDAVRAVPSAASGRAARCATAWLDAVDQGLRDGDLPEEERALLLGRGPGLRPRDAMPRREKEAQISAWRRAEARARGVGEQVVLPGHCAHDLLDIALAAASDPAASPALEEAIAGIPGIGARRLERYKDALVTLASAPSGRRPPPLP